jgi:chromatin modification-related protein VID21
MNYFASTVRCRIAGRIDAYQNHRANNCSGIVTSRKRKLRELYAIATSDDVPITITTLPPPEEPPTTTEEVEFLELSDILQCVSQFVTLSIQVAALTGRH